MSRVWPNGVMTWMTVLPCRVTLGQVLGLRGGQEVQPDIAAQPFNVALAARDAFGLTVVQLQEVRAWLEGLRTDDELIQVLDPSSS
ncbi:hypothetical protein [Streptomyces sp. NPDC020917]|uniref:hypothetical protein n=1 Tax=Streptomyces sp. NPDC020917 TaxID=3365102 RepID=UPI0037958AC4